MMLLPLTASAYDALVDGIYYNLDADAKTAEVTYKDNYFNSYSGFATIPSSFTYLEMNILILILFLFHKNH